MKRFAAVVLSLLLVSCGSTGYPVADDTVAPAPRSSASSPEQPPTPVSVDADGMQRSGIAASGRFVANSFTIEPSTDQPDVIDYLVQVETSTGLDANEVANQVQQVLDSPHGWVGTRGIAFRLTNEPKVGQLTILLASPATVDAGCGDLGTDGTWSCRVGDRVYLNVDRWLFATPTWANAQLADYRAYLINHEVGHYLGFNHVGCPATGALSPVMQQQSINLNGCLPNAWPDVTGEKR